MFNDELSLISNSIKNSKKNRFDLLHSFLLNSLPSNITSDSVLLNPNTSSLYATIHNLEYLDRGYAALEKKLSDLGADIKRIKS